MKSSEGTYGGNDERVLVLLRESRDAESVPRVVEGIGVASKMCATPEELCAEIGRGAGALLFEEEVLSPRFWACLLATLKSQPSWSELPIIILLGRGPETQLARDALLLPGDVTLVERPVRVTTLVAVVRSALRSRRRQYVVRDQMRALEQSESRLQAANRELESFNYTVAHDLRKPLTVVNGYCQAIMELYGPTLDQECLTFVREAYEGTLRMNRLIDALLLFSQAAHAQPKREWVDLSAVAQEVAMELKQAEPARTVTFRIAPGLAVEGDENLLRVVVANLLGNSWKFTADREEAVIELGAEEINGKPICFVRDNGIGFDSSEAGEIFTPFQRLTSGQRIGGLGIGLATVQRIITAHGGRIWAEGEPGKGATFFFTVGEAGAHTGEGTT